MARPSSLIRHVESFIDSSSSPELQKASVNAISELVKKDVITVDGLVRELELYLTTTDSTIRSRGILILAEIMGQLISKPLHHSIIHHLTGFFSSRLADWQALHGALVGCVTLLRRTKDVGAVIGSDSKILAQSFLQHIQVQSLSLADRKLCFELCRYLLDLYPNDVATLGEDLVHGICAAIEQEKDPECLNDGFRIIKSLVNLYPESSDLVRGCAREIFEVFSAYFPVYFTNDEDASITREELSEALMNTFCASPFFEEFAIPLLLDKLGSSLPLAKLDSLKYLGSCIKFYGANQMSKHAKTLWLSLKDVILNFPWVLFPFLPWKSFKVKDSLSRQIAEESLTCLRIAICEFSNSGDESFARQIICDQDIEAEEENEEKIIAVGNILSELVKVPGPCSEIVIKKYFPHLLNSLEISFTDSLSSSAVKYYVKLNFRALYLSVVLISSCRELVATVEEGWPLLQRFSVSLVHPFCSLLKSSLLGEDIASTRFGQALLLVKSLEYFATFPTNILQLSAECFEEILTSLMSIIVGNYEISLWKAALEALSHIGAFISKNKDSDRERSYRTIVIEKILSFLRMDDDSLIPLESKLEACYSVGSTSEDFMLRVIQELEEAIFHRLNDIHVTGEMKNEKTLLQLHNFFSRQVLPWCKKTGHFDIVGLHFIERVWDQLKVISEEKIFDALVMTTKNVVSGCGVENQVLIVKKAFNILSSMKLFSPEQLTVSSIRDVLTLIPLSQQQMQFVSLFASVLMALLPQTPIPETRVILSFLMVHLLRGCRPAAQALGSLLNKWSSESTAMILEEALDFIMDLVLLNLSADFDGSDLDETQILLNALIGLAWIGKGLVMRGHERAEKVTSVLLKCLSSEKENDRIQEGSHNMLVSRTAADGFHILFCDSDECLNRMFHATIRPLFQQRLFSALMPALQCCIKDCRSQVLRTVLYEAFGHIISNTPQAAIINESTKVVSFLLDALSVLAFESRNKDLVYSMLLVVSGIITADNGRKVVEENTHAVIYCLIGLTSFRHMMLVRETAVQCLMAISDLPYARIYPFTSQVLRAMSCSIDDGKRPVRLEAVKCRQAWASMGSRGILH
ncbi:ARM repeat superfamily protein [Wolffia australiana]